MLIAITCGNIFVQFMKVSKNYFLVTSVLKHTKPEGDYGITFKWLTKAMKGNKRS